MNTIGGNNNVGVDVGAICEGHTGFIIALREPDTMMTAMDHIIGKRGRQEVNEIN